MLCIALDGSSLSIGRDKFLGKPQGMVCNLKMFFLQREVDNLKVNYATRPAETCQWVATMCTRSPPWVT